MPPEHHAFDWPDRFVVGTVGPPGSRTFYLQARERDELFSVALEKEQAAAIAAGVDQILDELRAQEGNPVNVPAASMPELEDSGPLEEPIEERFRVGPLTLGWDPATLQVVLEAAALPADLADLDPEEFEPEEILTVRLPVGAARAFAKRARDVVAAGRR